MAKKWRFYGMDGNKSSLLIDSPITCMQSTETTFAGMTTNWLGELISNVDVVATVKAFFLLGVTLVNYN